MRHCMKDFQFWNKTDKPAECEAIAEPNDLIYYDGGILYLVQTKDEFNNVVCFRMKKTKTTVKQSFYHFRRFCIKNKIQFIRVEGNPRRYLFLKMFEKGLSNQGYNVRKAADESFTLNRNVFYIKLCNDNLIY